MKLHCKLYVLAILLLCLALFSPSLAEGKKLRVVTTLTDLASLTQEVGGDRIDVEALAKGYQDPHFVEPKPSFLLKLRNADLLISVGLDLEIGWLPPLITQSGNGRIQPGAPGYLDASQFTEILEIPQGKLTRAEGDVRGAEVNVTKLQVSTAAADAFRSVIARWPDERELVERARLYPEVCKGEEDHG